MSYSPESHHHTGQRFNLSNGVIAADWVESEASQIRNIKYRPNPASLTQREHLAGEGLVLGLLTVSTGEEDTFTIPTSARPLWYEARSFAQGELTYNDHSLMRELGQLVGAVHRLSGGQIIAGGAGAERAFALVDHVPVGARQLFLLPGTEQFLHNAPRGDLLADQMAAFSLEFAVRFGPFVNDFMQGYASGQEGATHGR